MRENSVRSPFVATSGHTLREKGTHVRCFARCVPPHVLGGSEDGTAIGAEMVGKWSVTRDTHTAWSMELHVRIRADDYGPVLWGKKGKSKNRSKKKIEFSFSDEKGFDDYCPEKSKSVSKIYS